MRPFNVKHKWNFYVRNIYERICDLNAYRYRLIFYLRTSPSRAYYLHRFITSLQAWFAGRMDNDISSLKWVEDATAAGFAKPVSSCTDEVQRGWKARNLMYRWKSQVWMEHCYPWICPRHIKVAKPPKTKKQRERSAVL